jgi:hypothetical protein
MCTCLSSFCVYFVCSWWWDPLYGNIAFLKLPQRPLFCRVCMGWLLECEESLLAMNLHSVLQITNTSALLFHSPMTLDATPVWEASEILWMTSAGGGTFLYAQVLCKCWTRLSFFSGPMTTPHLLLPQSYIGSQTTVPSFPDVLKSIWRDSVLQSM